MPLTTNTEVKALFNISYSGDDTLLTTIIAQAQKEAETFCGYAFDVATYTEYFDGTGNDSVRIGNLPIASITTLHDDILRAYGADTLVDSDDYVFYKDQGIIKLDGFNFDIGLKNIKVVYIAGYGTGGGTAPTDLKLAIQKLTASIYLAGKGSVNSTTGDDVISKDAQLRKDAYAILAKYKKWY